MRAKELCFWTVVLEKTLESPLNCKEKKPVSSKGKQSWIVIGRIDAKVEVPMLWHVTQRADSWKDPDAGKDWRQEETAMREDEIAGWQHQLNGHEFEPALGTVKDTGVWQAAVHGVTESDPAEWLNNPLLQFYVMETLTQGSSLHKENQEYWAAFPTGPQSRAGKSSLKNPGRIWWEHVMK